MYLISIGFISFYFMMRKFNKINSIPKKKYTIKYIPNDKLYFYCDDILKFYYRNEIEKTLQKNILLNNSKNLWNTKLSEVHNNLFLRLWKINIKKINQELTDNLDNNYCIWVYENEINYQRNNKLIILDFNSIFNYIDNKFIDKEYLLNLSEFCYKNKIIFVIITELHPTFVSKFDIKYLNNHNIITPFHFKVRALGGITRLKENQLAGKPAEISINKIIIDIFNRYGCNYNDTFYIGSNAIPKLKCKLLSK